MEEPTPEQRTDLEPEIKPEPEDFPVHLVTVKTEEEEEECGPFSRSDRTDSSDTDRSDDYSQQQAAGKRSYAMVPPDATPSSCSNPTLFISSSNPTLLISSNPTLLLSSNPTLLISPNPTLFISPNPTPLVSSNPTPLVSSNLTPLVSSNLTPLVSSNLTPLVSSNLTPLVSSNLTPLVSSNLTPLVSSNLTPLSYSAFTPFSCLECGKVMMSAVDVVQHMKTHAKLKPFVCSVCSQGFARRAGLLRHKLHLHNMCVVCGGQCEDKAALTEHLKGHVEAGAADEAVLKEVTTCSLCGLRLRNISRLEKHMKIHVGEGPQQCLICHKRFMTENALRGHLKFHSQRSFRCSVCGEMFDSQPKRKVHMKIHSGSGPFVCSVCGRRFKQISSCSKHMGTHGEKSFRCSGCKKRYVHELDLIYHRLKAHHACPVCSEGFQDEQGLKEHLSSHPESEVQEVLAPFSCSVCGGRFRWDYALQAHMKKHSEKKMLFECSLCKRGFKNKDQFKKHVALHALLCPECGVRLATKLAVCGHLICVHRTCPVCEEHFSDREALKEHMRSHSGVCHECGLTAKSKSLSLHLIIAHDMCSVCEQRFSHREDLEEHLKSHIKDGTLEPSSVQIHVCSDCGDMFFYKSQFQEHVRARETTGCPRYSGEPISEEELLSVCVKTEEDELPLHTIKTEDSSESGAGCSSDPLPQLHTNDTPFSCSYCEKSFKTNFKLKTHTLVHTRGPFICSDCNQHFRRKQILISHKKNVHHICPVCSERFQGQPELHQHRKVHMSDGTLSGLHFPKSTVSGPLHCPECNKTLKSERCLRNHLKYHSGRRPFKCSICDETFTSNTKLKLHMKGHTGQGQRAACTVCRKRFRSQSSIASHMKSHRDKPFSCSVCGRSYMDGADLTLHLAHTHLRCPFCEEQPCSKAALKEHVKSHVRDGTVGTSTQVLICCDCGQMFRHDFFLQRHIRLVHTSSTSSTSPISPTSPISSETEL